MPCTTSSDTSYRFQWALWALASLTTLSFAPGAWFVTHLVYHRVQGYGAVLPYSTHASMWLGSHLGLVAVVLSAGSGTIILKHRSAGNFAICAQVLLFFALCGVMATGLLAPFEVMCFHPEGLVP